MQRFNRPALFRKGTHVLRSTVLAALALVAGLAAGRPSQAATLRDRLSASVSLADRVELPKSGSLRAATSTPLGHLAAETTLTSMRLVLQPSAAQQADLTQLLADQANPSSPQFHRWLSPAQFGARFGVSDNDLAVLQQWLTSQGFTVQGVAPGRNAILFSGTSALVETAFGTSMQRFSRGGQDFFENSTSLHIPAAFSGMVAGVSNLSSYRVRSNRVAPVVPAVPASRQGSPQADFTATLQGAVKNFLTPYDFRQIYNLNGLAGSGFNGKGITIAVAGQSAIDTTQIGYFQTLTGQTVNAPQQTLVPSTGTSTLVPGDEGESEIDVEYAGGTASGATVNFVYVGNSANFSVFDSVIYAIDQKLAPIISLSYGSCETSIPAGNLSSLEFSLAQANAQGQTVIASSGDQDAATCDASDSVSGAFTTAIGGATVSYPASSVFVTGVGGTQLNDGNVVPSPYFAATNNSQNGTALGYIPEIAWNDTAVTTSVSGTGGGKSQIFSKPSWQTGDNVPSDGRRDVPDISFAASPNFHGYTFCSAELNSSGAASGEACTPNSFASIVGGTSLSAPNFAAMLAIIEQANGTTGGLGNVNPLLYAIASGSSGATAFHDITTGNNFVACTAGYPDCVGGQLGYATGPGYDLVTGIGSADGQQLANALKTAAAAHAVATVVLSISPAAPTLNQGTIATAVVTATANGPSPTGTITFTIDGAVQAPVTLVKTAATLPSASINIGAGFSVTSHTIVAAYSGDASYAAATSTLNFAVPPPVTGTFAVTAAAPTVTIPTGSTVGTEQLTFTSTAGFTDLVDITVSVVPNTLAGCYSFVRTPVPANGTSVGKLTINTSVAQCAKGGANRLFTVAPAALTAAPAATHASKSTPSRPLGLLALGGLLAGCFGLRRSRRLSALLAVLFTAGALSLAGCGGNSSTALVPPPITTPTNPAPATGSYTISVAATSLSNTSITATTNFTLTVQ